MKKIKIESIDLEIEVNEEVIDDWRYMDYLTMSEDPDLRGAERFRAINKSLEMLIGMQQKRKVLARIAEKNDDQVSYKNMYAVMTEISEVMKDEKK